MRTTSPARRFYASHKGEIGGGNTLQEAYEDLLRLLEQRSAQ
jgi:hypothetical protein